MRGEFKSFSYLSCISSFIIALMLTIFPVSINLLLIWPQWVLLLLIYWVIVAPEKIGVITAFILGVILDGLLNSPLGLHALALVIVVCIVQKFRRRIYMFFWPQQALCVFFLALLYELLICLESLIIGQHFHWFIIPSFITAALWPALIFVMSHKKISEEY